MKTVSPVLGFNNNVRYRGKTFHVQTEDSGVLKPHVITHLFVDGGRIVRSVKTSYADKVSEPNVSELVRALMKEQHKAMFIGLKEGKYDALVWGENGPEPVPETVRMPPSDAMMAAAASVEVMAASDSSPSIATATVSSPEEPRRPSALDLDLSGLQTVSRKTPPPRPPSSETLLAVRPPVPPESASVPVAKVAESASVPVAKVAESASVPVAKVKVPSGTRPAIRLDMTRPGSLFGGEDNDVSLDDVILNYLTDDAVGAQKKR